MSVKTTTIVTCDICDSAIGSLETRVFAGVYGRDFHIKCLQHVNGSIIGLLVDDVRVGTSGEYADSPGHATRLYWDKRKLDML